MKHFTDEQVEEALIKTNGFLSAAARLLGCNRLTLFNKIKDSPELSSFKDDLIEERLDSCENELLHMISGRGARPNRGAVPEAVRFKAIAYYLNSKGRDRGFGKLLMDDSSSKRVDINGFLGKLSDAIERGGDSIEM